MNLSSTSSFLLRQEVVYPLLEELVIVNDGGVPMRGVSDPLGTPVVAVALKQDVRVKLELLLSAQELADLGRTLGEQPQALVDIVPEIIISIRIRINININLFLPRDLPNPIS